MIETFKIVTGIYDTVVSPNMLAAGPSYATRGHDLRLQKSSSYYSSIILLVILSLQNL